MPTLFRAWLTLHTVSYESDRVPISLECHTIREVSFIFTKVLWDLQPYWNGRPSLHSAHVVMTVDARTTLEESSRKVNRGY